MISWLARFHAWLSSIWRSTQTVSDPTRQMTLATPISDQTVTRCCISDPQALAVRRLLEALFERSRRQPLQGRTGLLQVSDELVELRADLRRGCLHVARRGHAVEDRLDGVDLVLDVVLQRLERLLRGLRLRGRRPDRLERAAEVGRRRLR